MCMPVRLSVFAPSLLTGLNIRKAHSSLWAYRGVKQGNILGDMFYSPTSQLIFTSPLSWRARVSSALTCPPTVYLLLWNTWISTWHKGTEKDAIEFVVMAHWWKSKCFVYKHKLQKYSQLEGKVWQWMFISLYRTIEQKNTWSVIITGYELHLLAQCKFGLHDLGNIYSMIVSLCCP